MNRVIMPALEMAQETGKLVHWLKREGETVAKGEPIMEIETDKVTVEIESPASGTLGGVRAGEGDVVPVGQTIAWILADGETPPADSTPGPTGRAHTPLAAPKPAAIAATPLARKVAGDIGVDLATIPSDGKRIEKADVLAYFAQKQAKEQPGAKSKLASPKARRLAAERGIDVASLSGFTDVLRLDGNAFTSAYDRAAKTITKTTPTGVRQVLHLDEHGRLSSVDQGAGRDPAQLTYNSRGHVATMSDGASSIAADARSR